MEYNFYVSDHGERENLMCKDDELSKVVYLTDEVNFIEVDNKEITKEVLNMLNSDFLEADRLNEIDIPGYEFKLADDKENYRSQIMVYKCNGKWETWNLLDANEHTEYQFWDGHNWKYTCVEGENSQYQLAFEIDGNFPTINLDEWDGNNWNFGGTGHHGKIFVNEGTFYVYYYSQYQECDIYWEEIGDQDQLEKWLEHNNRANYLDRCISNLLVQKES